MTAMAGLVMSAMVVSAMAEPLNVTEVSLDVSMPGDFWDGNICNRDSGGTCWLFGCKTSRGPVFCDHNHCICQPGYCARGGACHPDSSSSHYHSPLDPSFPQSPTGIDPPSAFHHRTMPRHGVDGGRCLHGWRGTLFGKKYTCHTYCCYVSDAHRRTRESWCRVSEGGMYKLEECMPRSHAPQPYQYSVTELAAEERSNTDMDDMETEVLAVPVAAGVLAWLLVLAIAATVPTLFIVVSITSKLGCCRSRAETQSNLSEPLLPVS
mmetsp:Transcript_46999/g.105399  ORF Transcript_46999/g.105399 Transcript_46999/m.105399 type:complete len:265 (-) Transcript_46999:124-918(-)